MLQTVKSSKMQRGIIACISTVIVFGLCAATSEREKRPLIYTDGSTGPKFKQFSPISMERPVRGRSPLSGRSNRNQATLSFQTSKFLHRWGNETNILLVGGKDHVYMMSGVLEDDEPALTYHKLLTWRSTEYKQQCQAVPNRNWDLCENYIQYIELMEDGQLLVCGSNAFHPTCRYYLMEHFSTSDARNSAFVREDEKCRGRCPASPYPTTSATSFYTEIATSTNTGHQIFAALINADKDPIIMRNDGPTLLSNPLWLKEPTFLKMIEFENYIYIFFREVAEEWESGKDRETYARVARICKNDEGGVHALWMRWTTFIKARLICDKSGRENNVFNNLTSVSDIVSIPDNSANVDNVVFATFTSPWEWEDSSMSAVCAYSMSEIARKIDEGRLLGKQTVELHDLHHDDRITEFLPVHKATTITFPIESGRYGRYRKCGDIRTVDPATLNFVNDYNLLYDQVKPKFGNPLYTTSNFRATHITIDYKPGRNQNIMIYVGSEEGKLLRLRNRIISPNEWRTGLIENRRVVEERKCMGQDCAIRSLHISRPGTDARPSVFAAFTDRMMQMPLSICGAYKARECCSFDPDCGWNGIECVERIGNINELELSRVTLDSEEVPEPCRALGMVTSMGYDCGRSRGQPEIADALEEIIPPSLLAPRRPEQPPRTPDGRHLEDLMTRTISGSLEQQYQQASNGLGTKQIRAMHDQLQEAVTSTIKLVLENHEQEYCLPSPSVNQLVHVYPLLLKEMDKWHAGVLRKMTAPTKAKCWNERTPCLKRESFSLPLVHVLWEPLQKLINNFSGSCHHIDSERDSTVYTTTSTRPCVPLPGMEKCKDHSQQHCKTSKCSFAKFAVDPIAFFRHANDTRLLYNSDADINQTDPLKKPVSTMLNGQIVQGHLEVVVSNSYPFSIYYEPVQERVKISFYYKPVKCNKVDSLVDDMFNSVFDNMYKVRRCSKEIRKKDKTERKLQRQRNRRHRQLSRRSEPEPNVIYARPTKCRYVIAKNIGTPELTVSDETWNKLAARFQQSGGLYVSGQQTIRFTEFRKMKRFFRNDCPINSTIERTTFIKISQKNGLRLTPLVSTETPFVITRKNQKITLRYFYTDNLS